MKVTYIDTFLFEKATYRIATGKDVEVLLHIFYAANTFQIERLRGEVQIQMAKELQSIARDLLQRKHQVNFAEK